MIGNQGVRCMPSHNKSEDIEAVGGILKKCPQTGETRHQTVSSLTLQGLLKCMKDQNRLAQDRQIVSMNYPNSFVYLFLYLPRRLTLCLSIIPSHRIHSKLNVRGVSFIFEFTKTVRFLSQISILILLDLYVISVWLSLL